MKKNLLFLLVLIAFAGFFYWDRQQEAQQKEKEEIEKQLFTLKKDEVKEITIVKGKTTFQANQDGDRWKLVLPFAADGDKSAWDSIASSFTTGKLQRVVEENVADMSPFGLKTPALSVSLAGVGGATKTTLCFGDETPTSGKYFASVQGTSDVLTVYSSLYNLANKELYDFRDKTIVDMETNQVQKVEIAHGGFDLAAERQGDNQWIITRPIQARADESKINDMINGVKNGQIKQFIEENPESVEAYGLINPATKLVFWTGEKNNQSSWASRALLIGGTSAAQHWYAKREGQNNVFSVAPTDFSKIPTDVDSLRLRKTTSLRSWEIASIKLTSGTSVIVEASKSGGDWFLIQPQSGKANYTEISNFVRGISELQAAAFVQGTTEEYGLAEPDVVIELSKENSSVAADTTIQSPTQEVLVLSRGEAEKARYYYGARNNPLEIYGIRIEDVDKILLDARGLKLVPESTPEPETDSPSEEQ